MSPLTLRGACLGEACSYEVPDEFEYSLICHCSQCRRATGSAFESFAGIQIDRVRLTSPSEETQVHGDGAAHDVHGRSCGSLLFSSVREHAYAPVTLGALIDPPSITPSAHIFVGSKAVWYEILDQLPQFEELPA